MFLQKKIFKRLMTEAYKHRLIVAMTEDDWLYIAGSYWEVNIKREYIPKETMGDIIALIGELPEPGERFSATKEGNQMEFDGKRQIDVAPRSQHAHIVFPEYACIYVIKRFVYQIFAFFFHAF